MWTIKIIQYLYKIIINLFFGMHLTTSQADVIYLPVKDMLECNWSHLLWLSREEKIDQSYIMEHNRPFRADTLIHYTRGQSGLKE